MLSIALLIGRLLVAPSNPPPSNVTDQAVLFIKWHDFVDPCAAPDAATDDGGVGDAGTDATPADAGADAGPDDAGVGDGGVPDAGVCGLQRIDTITMIVQPEVVLAVPTSFAMLYVTPARPQVTSQPSGVFGELAQATAPMIETVTVHIEDSSLGQQCTGGGGCGGGAEPQQSSGCGGGYEEYERSPWDPPSVADGGTDGTGIETVGPYEIVRVQPATAQELTDWLEQLGYTYEQADIDAVTPYLLAGYHVVAARVKATGEIARRLTPLAFTWQGDEIRVPIALGRMPQMPLSTIPLTVYIAAEGRYQLPGASVNFAMPTSYPSEAGFLTRNDVWLDTNQPASADPIAVPSNLGQYRATRTITVEKHVPVAVSCEDDNLGLCSDCSSGSRRQIDFGTIAFAALIALRRHRRPRARN